MREFFAKITDQLTKFLGITVVKLFRLVQFRMTASGSICNDTPQALHPPSVCQHTAEMIRMRAVDHKIGSAAAISATAVVLARHPHACLTFLRRYDTLPL
jgi:hypothetical protein